MKENSAPAQFCRITEVGSLFNQPNIFKLPIFNEYFILGPPVPLTTMALQSSYEQYYDQQRSSMQAAMSKDILDTNSLNAACFPQYTTSRSSIYHSSQDAPAGAAEGAPAAAAGGSNTSMTKGSY